MEYAGIGFLFFAYTHGVMNGKAKKGDLIFFITVGVGHTICSMLVRA